MPYLTLGKLEEDETKNIPSEFSRYEQYAILNEMMKHMESGTDSYKYDELLKGRESGAGSTSIEKGPHEEMSLDQFYYSTLSEIETRSRDKDQVLSRYLSPADESQIAERSKMILVVHQLWLFVIDESTSELFLKTLTIWIQKLIELFSPQKRLSQQQPSQACNLAMLSLKASGNILFPGEPMVTLTP